LCCGASGLSASVAAVHVAGASGVATCFIHGAVAPWPVDMGH
jgi:hypothetical protein